MNVIEKSEILSLVAGSGLPRRRALAQLGLAKSTYYRWLRRQAGGRLQDRKGGSPVPWNKLRPEEEEQIFVLARAFPELSSRELALKIVDTGGWYVQSRTRSFYIRFISPPFQELPDSKHGHSRR